MELVRPTTMPRNVIRETVNEFDTSTEFSGVHKSGDRIAERSTDRIAKRNTAKKLPGLQGADMKPSRKKSKPRGRPISIPLSFDEAVRGLIAVDPKSPVPEKPAKKKAGRKK
jgi:hypothetical protein